VWGNLGFGVSAFEFIPIAENAKWSSKHHFHPDHDSKSMITSVEIQSTRSWVVSNMSARMFEQTVENMALWTEFYSSGAQAEEFRSCGKILLTYRQSMMSGIRDKKTPWVTLFDILDMHTRIRT